MLISLDWISDFVDLDGLSPEEIADRFTMATAEVEGFERLHRFVAGVVVGEIVEAVPIIGDAGKILTACRVRAGEKVYRTVCGAANARVGLKAPFAPAGTTLGTVTIAITELAGYPSEGILCSAAELGMSHWHEILFECPDSIPSGTPFDSLVPESDILIEIDNKSLTHRPDLWGHYGVAREIAAIFRRPLRPLPQHAIETYQSLPEIDITIADDNCPCYGAIVFGVEAGVNQLPSPIKMQRRLHALGQRTYNLLIDVTNYVSLELGQPTHAFDADLVQSIRVAPMGEKGFFQTLDGGKREMLPDDMLICDGSKPIAIAGIMGGLETEVTDRTTRVLLESANFKAARIRKTSTRLDLRTDASQRYEKSQPPCNVKVAAQRILQLIEDAGIPLQVESRFSIAGSLNDEPRTVTLPPGRLNHLAGIDFSNETIIQLLGSIGLITVFREDGTLQVSIPPFRSQKDIAIPEDIVEEVMRLYGFDNIPPVMPRLALCPLHVEEYIQMEHKARRLLTGGWRFWEVHHYGWMNDNWLTKLGFEPGETLTLLNPAAQFESRMRTTLLPNLFTLVPKNRPNFDRFRIFEIGRIYQPVGKANSQEPCRDSSEKCAELPRLAGLSFLQSGMSLQDHYLEIKGAIEELGILFHEPTPLTFTALTETLSPWAKPGSAVAIYQGETLVGTMGIADSNLMSILSPEGGQVVWFELYLDKLAGHLYPKVQFTEPPKFPGSWQDFSLLWKIAAGYELLEKKLSEFTDPLLRNRRFVTQYSGKGIEKGTASYSFRFEIGADDHTLTGEEIETFHQKFLKFLQENQIALRG